MSQRAWKTTSLLAVSALLALSACSSNSGSEILGGSVTVSPSPSASSFTLSDEEIEEAFNDLDDSDLIDVEFKELVPGIIVPKSVVEIEPVPNIPRGAEAPAAAEAAQSIAAAYLYNTLVFAPKPGGPRAEDLRTVPGLTVWAGQRWWDFVKDDESFRNSMPDIKGLVFIPDGVDGKRGYSIPAVSSLSFSDIQIAEGPPSSLDGAPTLIVSFTLEGALMWKTVTNDTENFFVAPVERDIVYTMAEQSGTWLLDDWKPSILIVGEPRPATDAELAGQRFTDPQWSEPEPGPTAEVTRPSPSESR